MNERIKELVEKSKEYAKESTKNFTGDEPIGFMDFYTEKFAELIVKECLDTVAVCGGTTKFDHWSAIKEHFGVEE